MPKPPPGGLDSFVHRSPKGATLLDIRTAMRELRTVLIDANVAQVDVSCIEIVVAEILNNVVKHAHHGSDHGWFDLQCTFLANAFHFICRDNGVRMPGDTPPIGVLPEVNRPKCDLPEGGWGWSLVRALSVNLNYNRVQDMNVVSFKIPRSSSTLRR